MYPSCGIFVCLMLLNLNGVINSESLLVPNEGYFYATFRDFLSDLLSNDRMISLLTKPLTLNTGSRSIITGPRHLPSVSINTPVLGRPRPRCNYVQPNGLQYNTDANNTAVVTRVSNMYVIKLKYPTSGTVSGGYPPNVTYRLMSYSFVPVASQSCKETANVVLVVLYEKLNCKSKEPFDCLSVTFSHIYANRTTCNPLFEEFGNAAQYNLKEQGDYIEIYSNSTYNFISAFYDRSTPYTVLYENLINRRTGKVFKVPSVSFKADPCKVSISRKQYQKAFGKLPNTTMQSYDAEIFVEEGCLIREDVGVKIFY